MGTIEKLFGFIAPTREHTRAKGYSYFFRPASRRVGAIGGHALTSEKKLPDKPKKSTAAQSKNRDMGSALRSVYQKTVEEAVPDDLMSLLGKLD